MTTDTAHFSSLPFSHIVLASCQSVSHWWSPWLRCSKKIIRYNLKLKLSVIKYAKENSGEAAARRFCVDQKSVRETQLQWTSFGGGPACKRLRTPGVADWGVLARLYHRWPVLCCSEQSSISSRSVAAKLWQEKILKSRFKVKAELELIWTVMQLYAFTRNPMPLLIAVQNIRSLPAHRAYNTWSSALQCTLQQHG